MDEVGPTYDTDELSITNNGRRFMRFRSSIAAISDSGVVSLAEIACVDMSCATVLPCALANSSASRLPGIIASIHQGW